MGASEYKVYRIVIQYTFHLHAKVSKNSVYLTNPHLASLRLDSSDIYPLVLGPSRVLSSVLNVNANSQHAHWQIRTQPPTCTYKGA